MNANTITITLELRLSGDCLTGSVKDRAGVAKDFAGWLGLVAAIDALVQHGGDLELEPSSRRKP